jgi:hypothetical protein
MKLHAMVTEPIAQLWSETKCIKSRGRLSDDTSRYLLSDPAHLCVQKFPSSGSEPAN